MKYSDLLICSLGAVIDCARNLRRRATGIMCAIAAVPACLAGAGVAATEPVPPNIVVFLIDDLGWKDVGFMGNPWVRTPAIDRLSREGMAFTSAYSCGPNCAPSRASLMTGLYGPRHGIYTVGNSDRGPREEQALIPTPNRTELPASFVTLAESLQARGYVSAQIGKWHLGEDPGPGPLGQGFDVNVGGDLNGSPPKGYFAPYGLPNLEDAPPGEYLTDRLAAEARTFIKINRTRPFFLYFSHYAVHTPRQAPAADIEAYRRWAGSNGSFNPTYAAMIEAVDRTVGHVLDDLDRLGLADNTVVVFTSDNGGVSGVSHMAPLRGAKGMLYEGGIRVPLVVRWPGHVQAGSTCELPTLGLDLYPTLLEIAGGKSPDDPKLDGLSLVPLLEQRPGFQREAVFFHFPAYLPEIGVPGARDAIYRTRPCGVVRAGDWKLLEYFEDGALELYNLRDDIGETRNLASAAPETRDRLLELMRQWRTETNAPIPVERNPLYHGAGASATGQQQNR